MSRTPPPRSSQCRHRLELAHRYTSWIRLDDRSARLLPRRPISPSHSRRRSLSPDALAIPCAYPRLRFLQSHPARSDRSGVDRRHCAAKALPVTRARFRGATKGRQRGEGREREEDTESCFPSHPRGRREEESVLTI